MARAAQISRRTASALQLLDTHDPDTPTGIQLTTTSAEQLRQALEVIEHEVCCHALASSLRPFEHVVLQLLSVLHEALALSVALQRTGTSPYIA